jgi:hypothetical protein
MAQWYTQLLFKGETFLEDSLADWQEVEESAPDGLNGIERFTAVIVSGYALYGQVQGYYALGIAHIGVDPKTGKACYLSEKSALHSEPVDSLTPNQKQSISDWLKHHYPTAWENSTHAFKGSLKGEPV